MVACLLALVPSGSRAQATGEEAPPLRPLHDLGDAFVSFARDGWEVVTFPTRLDRRGAATLAGVLAVGGLLYAYDAPITERLTGADPNRLHRGIRSLGDALEPAGLMGNTNQIWAAGVIVGYLTRQEWLRRPARDLLYSHFIGGLTRNPLRDFIGRRRPDDGLGARTYQRGDGTSFPSGHASTIMQVATVLSHHVEQRWIDVLLYGLAGTVLFQRIDAEKHWASDVWIGAAWGWGVARTVVDDGESRGGGDGGSGVGLSVARGPAGPALVLSVPLGGS